jgi:sec-independent protein translocase protein TatA
VASLADGTIREFRAPGRKTRYPAGMSGLTQPWHIVVILLIALLLFGGKRLPEIGRSLGSGMREFKDSVTGHGSPEPPQQLPPPESTTPTPQPTERETV